MTTDLPKGNGVILDLEATCCDNREFPRHHMEIIEIGAVAINSDLETISEYSTFIKPIRNPVLTTFCTSLTTITQEQIDTADTFPKASQNFAQWAAENEIAWWGSWGDYDYKQFKQDVQYHRVPHPIPQNHINLKEVFTENQRLSKKPGLQQAIKLCGMDFQGTAHRGIDDAKNIARILPYILGKKI